MLAKILIDSADKGERVGFAGALPGGLPQSQSLVQIRQGFVFLPQIGVDLPHGIEGHGLAHRTVRRLLDGKRFIEAVERFLQLPGLTIDRGEKIEIREQLTRFVSGPCLRGLLLILRDGILETWGLCAGNSQQAHSGCEDGHESALAIHF